ncbi:RES family NAD+ phosphorylase [Chitinophagaceae bacterium LWZ2-11]
MIIYRFSHKKYAHDISGTGAKLKAGRWNTVGIPVVYTSEHISLCLLEILVNTGTLDQLQSIQLMEIEIPDAVVSIHEIRAAKLKKDWFNDFDYTQFLGAEILKSKKSLLIKCPSAVIHQEHNYLLNPEHPDFKKVKLRTADDFLFDERLFKTGK